MLRLRAITCLMCRRWVHCCVWSVFLSSKLLRHWRCIIYQSLPQMADIRIICI